jgi:hypothetical protein
VLRVLYLIRGNEVPNSAQFEVMVMGKELKFLFFAPERQFAKYIH